MTLAGQQLFPVINSLWTWGETWAFGDPAPEELNPVLLMWWVHSRAERSAARKAHRRQFDFGAEVSFWLILSKDMCVLTDPGYEVNLLVTADLATLFRVWGGAYTTGGDCPPGTFQLRAFESRTRLSTLV